MVSYNQKHLSAHILKIPKSLMAKQRTEQHAGLLKYQ